MNIDNITSKFAELRAQIKAEFNTHLLELLQPVFEKFPKLESFAFTAYSPYFNDGDECTFSVHHEYSAEINGMDADDHDVDMPSTLTSYNDRNAWRETQWPYQVSTEMSKLLSQIPDEVFETAWGNHVKITITKDKIEVDEYTEHD